MSPDKNMNLAEAANMFLATLPQAEKQSHTHEINNFIRWFGVNQPVSGLTAPEVGNYAEHAVQSGADYLQQLKPVKAFLSYLKKKGVTATNYSNHLRPSQTLKKAPKTNPQRVTESSTLTQQGHADLTQQLEGLKKELPRLTEEITKARADKDFKENSPLDAAREAKAQVQSRINELEAVLKSAVLLDGNSAIAATADIGCTVNLKNVDSGEILQYKLVDQREADPLQGKISIVSPLGKSLLGKTPGAMVEVKAPVGLFRYMIDNIT